MLIGLVRHGQTDWNVEGRLQGQTDIPLNAEGVKQAEALANRLSSERPMWDAVLSSDLMRAYCTAEIIAEALGIPLLAGEKRLRERGFGECEGLLRSEREERWGLGWAELAPGIESDEAVRARGMQVIEELRKNQRGKNILIVTHGSFLAQMLAALCPELEDERISNLSYSIVEWQEQGWKPLLHNCTAHLAQ